MHVMFSFVSVDARNSSRSWYQSSMAPPWTLISRLEAVGRQHALVTPCKRTHLTPLVFCTDLQDSKRLPFTGEWVIPASSTGINCGRFSPFINQIRNNYRMLRPRLWIDEALSPAIVIFRARACVPGVGWVQIMATGIGSINNVRFDECRRSYLSVLLLGLPDAPNAAVERPKDSTLYTQCGWKVLQQES